jgi:hypothetical protein
MRHKTLLTFCAVSLVLSAAAQKKQTLAFAITSSTQGSFQWTDVKLVDVNTGALVRTIFDSKQPVSAYKVYHARSGREIGLQDGQGVVKDQNTLPFHSMSAALAFDKKHNRIYYTPLYINQLRYIDLSSREPKIYYFENESFSATAQIAQEGNNITRMVIASDGNGYALSNDGNHLVRFGTGKRPVIDDLGALTDDAGNAVSIHERKTSWGGDMVADAFGNLYVVSAYHHVFKVNIRSKNASYLGKIEGLPGNFTTNGAVVDDEGYMIVSSASSNDSYYKVDMNNWKATRLDVSNKVFNASDLANGNLAFEPRMQSIPQLMQREIVRNDKISLYPNPATTGRFRVSFHNKELGRYDIQLVDLSGRLVSSKTVNIMNQGQTAEIDLRGTLSQGTYLVKVLNYNKKIVFADKLIVAD